MPPKNMMTGRHKWIFTAGFLCCAGLFVVGMATLASSWAIAVPALILANVILVGGFAWYAHIQKQGGQPVLSAEYAEQARKDMPYPKMVALTTLACAIVFPAFPLFIYLTDPRPNVQWWAFPVASLAGAVIGTALATFASLKQLAEDFSVQLMTKGLAAGGIVGLAVAGVGLVLNIILSVVL